MTINKVLYALFIFLLLLTLAMGGLVALQPSVYYTSDPWITQFNPQGTYGIHLDVQRFRALGADDDSDEIDIYCLDKQNNRKVFYLRFRFIHYQGGEQYFDWTQDGVILKLTNEYGVIRTYPILWKDVFS